MLEGSHPAPGAVGRRSAVRVAVVGPFSGPRAAWGELLRQAVGWQQTPGIAWELHDDVGDVERALVQAQKIIGTGEYRAVIGHFNSHGAAAALSHYRAAGIPVLLPLSTGSGLLAGGGGGALRWCGENHGQLTALAHAAHRRGARILLITDDGSAYGTQLASAVLERTDLPLPVRRVADGKSDAVLVCGTHAGAAPTANRLWANGFRGEFFFPDDCAVPEFRELLGRNIRPAFVTRPAGGSLRLVEAAFAALTGALLADPDLAGAELLDMVRAHAGFAVTPDGDPEWSDPAQGWEVRGVDELRAGNSLPAPPAETPVVDGLVIGTGIVGVTTAAAIAARGRRVAMIGLGPGAPSATRHSGGLIRAYDPDPRFRDLAVHSYRLLWGLPDERLREYGFHRTGSLVLLGEADLDEAHRGVAELLVAGVEAHLIGRDQVRERWPALVVDDIAAAVWEPGGGFVTPLATASAFRARAQKLGVDCWYGRVLGVEPDGDGVRVLTEWGPVGAKTAVVATGSGVPDLRNRSGAAIGPAARVKRIRYGYFDSEGHDLPIVADLVTGMWSRPAVPGQSLLVGRPVDEWDVPASGGDRLTAEQVGHIRAGAVHRWPWLAGAEYLGGRFGTDLYGTLGPALGVMCADLPIVAAGVFSGGGIKSAPAAGERAASAVVRLLDRGGS